MTQVAQTHSPPHAGTRKKQVVIVGGGLSGLAAGVLLTSHGIPVTILEQKPSLGGRAYSFRDSTTGDSVDNGQHILIAGYQRTLEFLGTIGTIEHLSVQSRPSLLFHHPVRGFHRFMIPKVSSPLHLAAGVLGFSLFSFPNRLRLLRAGLALHRFSESDPAGLGRLTIAQWLDATGQPEEVRRSFWEPLAVSIMNESITRASALVFVRSLHTAFFGSWQNAALAIPSVGLSELYVEGAHKYIALRGGRILCGADVIEVLFERNAVSGVRLKNAVEVECAACILAVPPYRLSTLLPDAMVRDLHLGGWDNVPCSPIVSVHLWYEKDFMDADVVGLIGRRVQWLFNKRRISKEKKPGGHLSAVISAAHELVDCSNEELVKIAVEDIRSVYHEAPRMPAHALVIREKRATVSVTPDVEGLRPDQRTAIPNLFIAGDWTATGYPATIEGAIISADRCVDLILKSVAVT
jgi:squalene-associated FAD-dependent desaturase